MPMEMELDRAAKLEQEKADNEEVNQPMQEDLPAPPIEQA